ncbi:transketolase [bacterium]|nr:transketolase [bacterium]RQV95560.1 MAG: transketolase [bacterium]
MDSKKVHQLAVNTIRMLAVDAVEKAKSGHPGMPMGMADCAFVLWHRFLRFNPEDPNWINRDRFLLSAGHGSMLLYSMLHLSGYDVSVDDLRQFRQWGSRTPGHPEKGCLPGVETTTGPLGQGFANGVGMAIGSRILADRFNRDDFSPIDHHIYGIVSDGDIMEGITSEAASVAGHLQLGNIIYIYDDNRVTIDGQTNLTFSEDVEKRFQAYGWHTLTIDGHNHEEIGSAIELGIKTQNKPTLIIAKTHIGYGSPNRQDSSVSHGAPLGEDEVIATKKHLGWPLEPKFIIPEEIKPLFKERRDVLKTLYNRWQKQFKDWQQAYPDLRDLLNRMISKDLPDNLEEQLIVTISDKPAATRVCSQKILNKAAQAIPSIIGGSADLGSSVKTFIDGAGDISASSFYGRNLHFGIREHGMGGILNGIALYGGFIPYGSTFLVFADYMRPSIRLTSIMGLQVVYVFSHDSLFVGEDGPTHQPVEQIASLRMMPGLTVFRPADGLETAMAWAYALRRKQGPTALCLTRQTVPLLERSESFDPGIIQKGGYVLSREDGSKPDVILVATGSEVSIAVEAKRLLAKDGKQIRVVSMPSVEVFLSQDEGYRNSVIIKNVPLSVIEAATSYGWHRITRAPMLSITMDQFGKSAPYQVLAEKFGFTGESVAEKISSWLEELA